MAVVVCIIVVSDCVFFAMMVVALRELAFQELHFPLNQLVLIDGKFKPMSELAEYRAGSSTRTTPRSSKGGQMARARHVARSSFREGGE